MNKNKGLSHTINKIASYIFATLVLCFSSYNTWLLLYNTSGSIVIATLGLLLFEGGMLFWWHSFQHGANGLPQMAVSLIVFALCLIAVGAANMIELGAITLGVDSHLPNQLIVGATLIHLTAKMIYPLISPETARAIKTKILEGKLIDKADTMLDSKMGALAEPIAERMAESAKNALLLSIGYSDSTTMIQPAQIGTAQNEKKEAKKEGAIEGDFLE